jgi:hypothetical protein
MTHAHLVMLAARWLRQQGCGVVLTEPGRGSERPDAVGWIAADGSGWVVEAKRTRKDFLAEWSRPDRKEHRRKPGGMGTKRFYIAPSGVIRQQDLFENGWGLLEVWTGTVHLARPSSIFEPDLAAEMRLIVASFSRIEQSEDVKQQRFAFQR